MTSLRVRHLLFLGALLFGVGITACYETDIRSSASRIEAESVSGPAATKQARTAGPRGRATLVFREVVSQASEVEASPGDTLTIEAVIDAAGDEITGAVLFLSMDDDVIELVPQRFPDGPRPMQPFEKGDFINGEVYNNDTIGDVIGDPLANGLPLFQLRYFENIPAAPFGEPRVATGTGVLARFRVRVVGNKASTIEVDEVSPIGSSMGYFVLGKPGVTHAYKRVTTFRILAERIRERVVEPTSNGETLVDVTLLRLGLPVSDIEMSCARSVSGRSMHFDLTGETDATGTVRLRIEDGETGYYTIRARTPEGTVLGVWNSIPVNRGNRHRLTFTLSP